MQIFYSYFAKKAVLFPINRSEQKSENNIFCHNAVGLTTESTRMTSNFLVNYL